jgi:Flp pilus assembly protein TadD
VFSRLRLIGAVLGVALVAGGLWLFWRRTQAAAERGQPRRIAILPIENLTGRASLDWASRAMIEVAQLELGAGEEAAVFPARDAGEAAARQATDLGYGTLELDQPATGESAPRLRYAFFLENVARHAVLSQQRGAGTALNAASALAALLAGATGVRAPRPAGVRDDRTLELFSKQKYEKCTQADRQAYWCWERWAVSTFEAGKKDDALRIVAQGRALATAAPAAARARLDFAEATFRGDPALRLAALERLVQADPGSPGAITELASQFVADRRYAEAESLYRRALDANRRQSDVWNLLAYAQAWQGRFDDARKSVEEYDRTRGARSRCWPGTSGRRSCGFSIPITATRSSTPARRWKRRRWRAICRATRRWRRSWWALIWPTGRRPATRWRRTPARAGSFCSARVMRRRARWKTRCGGAGRTRLWRPRG